MKPVKRRKEERSEYPVQTKLTLNQIKKLQGKVDELKNEDWGCRTISSYLRNLILASLK